MGGPPIHAGGHTRRSSVGGNSVAGLRWAAEGMTSRTCRTPSADSAHCLLCAGLTRDAASRSPLTGHVDSPGTAATGHELTLVVGWAPVTLVPSVMVAGSGLGGASFGCFPLGPGALSRRLRPAGKVSDDATRWASLLRARLDGSMGLQSRRRMLAIAARGLDAADVA